MEWENLRHLQYFVQPGKAIYVKTDSNVIRHFCDNLFPSLSKNEIADCISGMNHRFKGGHDLIMDVGSTLRNNGWKEAAKQAGHILFTDFPTKAGIPIPGLSNSGLGKLLVEHGINAKYLCFNLTEVVNGSVGILCFGEGASDLISACSGNLEMNFSTFCDTFGEGAFQVISGIYTGSPLFIVSGIENIVAGIVSAWKTYTIQIDLIPFFGATLVSALLGFFTAKYLCKNEMSDAIQKSIKSGLITALFRLSTSFGYGAAACCAYMEYVKYLAERDSKQIEEIMMVDKKYYEKFVQVLDSFEDKKIRDAYLNFDNYIIDRMATSSRYKSLINNERLNVAMSALNYNRTFDMKKLTQGDLLVKYLESKR
ncbi:MAG: hypothetical protein J6T96_15530 [Bacteroidales bacterium]|nr:hypothetical protein [Bacteroidales bacterium]